MQKLYNITNMNSKSKNCYFSNGYLLGYYFESHFSNISKTKIKCINSVRPLDDRIYISLHKSSAVHSPLVLLGSCAWKQLGSEIS